MPGILLELPRIADETGIRFKSITPQPALPVAAYQVVPIDVAFDGSFYALSDFLFRLRTLVTVRRGELHAAGRLFSVASVDFAESDRGFPLLAATLKLNAYVYGLDLGAGRGSAPRGAARDDDGGRGGSAARGQRGNGKRGDGLDGEAGRSAEGQGGEAEEDRDRRRRAAARLLGFQGRRR